MNERKGVWSAIMASIAANIASPAFGLVMLATTGIGFQVILHGFRFPGAARRAAFGASFAEDNKNKKAYKDLLEDHKRATGEDRIPQGGYPDMGSGRFAELLPYDKCAASPRRPHSAKCQIAGPPSISPPSVFHSAGGSRSTMRSARTITMWRAPHPPFSFP